MEYILIALVSYLTHHSLGNLNPFILIYIITIFIIYHGLNLLSFYTFRNTVDWDTIVFGFNDTGNFCYLIQRICIHTFIHFIFVSGFNKAFLNKDLFIFIERHIYRDRACICWLTPYMTSMARDGLVWIQEPFLGLPCGCRGPGTCVILPWSQCHKQGDV